MTRITRRRPFATLMVALMMAAAPIAPALATDDTATTTEVAATIAPAPAAEAPAEVKEPVEEPVVEAVEAEAPAPVVDSAEAPAEVKEPVEEPVVEAVVVAEPIEREYTASCSVNAGTYTIVYSPEFNPGESGAYTVLTPSGEGGIQTSARRFSGNTVSFELAEFLGTTVETQGVIGIATVYPDGMGPLEYTGPFLLVNLSDCADITPVVVEVTHPSQLCVPGQANDVVIEPEFVSGREVADIVGPSDYAWTDPDSRGESTFYFEVLIYDDRGVFAPESFMSGTLVDNGGNCGQDVTYVTAVDGKFIDEPGAEFNLVFVPTPTEGVEYVVVKEGNRLTVTAVAADGSVLRNPGWSQTATDLLIPVVVDPEVPVVVDPEVPVVVDPEVPVVVDPEVPVAAVRGPGLPSTGTDGPGTPAVAIIVFIGTAFGVAAMLRRPIRGRR